MREWVTVAIYPTRTYTYRSDSQEAAETYAALEQSQALCLQTVVIDPDGNCSIEDFLGCLMEPK